MYEYRAKVVRVYDGDTITVQVDLGFHVSITETIRFARINTPEIRGEERPEGLKSLEWLKPEILNKTVLIRTDKDKTGKYGRYIADVFELDQENMQETGMCFNDRLVELKLAEYREY